MDGTQFELFSRQGLEHILYCTSPKYESFKLLLGFLGQNPLPRHPVVMYLKLASAVRFFLFLLNPSNLHRPF